MATVNRVFDKRNHKKIKNQFINVLLFWHLIEQSSIKNRLKKDFMKYDGYSYDYFLLYHFSGEVELGEEFSYLFILPSLFTVSRASFFCDLIRSQNAFQLKIKMPTLLYHSKNILPTLIKISFSSPA